MKKFNLYKLAVICVSMLITQNIKAEEITNMNNQNSTAVTITVGDKVIPATLNNTTTAKDLISRLPYSITLNKYSHDFCGNPTERLAYDEKDVQFGWKNGDISYEKQTPYFVIFFGDEDNSQAHGNQVIIGKVNADMETIKSLGNSSINLTIDLAK